MNKQQGTVAPTQYFDCFVRVVGVATDPDDETLPGWYSVAVKTTTPVDLSQLSAGEEHEVAKAVLDAFHDYQGIEVLDDFEITVILHNGQAITERDETTHPEQFLVVRADYCEKINYADVPDELRHLMQDQEGAPYSVIAVDSSSGQIYCDHVHAVSGLGAFAVVAARRANVDFVVAAHGHKSEDADLTFPGDGVVNDATVREQLEVFGSAEAASLTADQRELLKNGDVVEVRRSYVCIADVGDKGVVVDAPSSMAVIDHTMVLITARGFIVIDDDDVTPTGKNVAGATFKLCNSARLSGTFQQVVLEENMSVEHERIARAAGWIEEQGQIYRLLPNVAEDDEDEPNAEYANDWEEAALVSQNRKLVEHGSELDTRICFAVGELERDQLEETAANAGVDFDKWTTDDNLRADVIEAARRQGGLKVYDAEGGVTTWGLNAGGDLPVFDPAAEVPIPARKLTKNDQALYLCEQRGVSLVEAQEEELNC